MSPGFNSHYGLYVPMVFSRFSGFLLPIKIGTCLAHPGEWRAAVLQNLLSDYRHDFDSDDSPVAAKLQCLYIRKSVI